jgi:ribosomal protein S12 methylthiotransferase accessory factor
MFALEALRRAGFERVLAIDYSLPELAPIRAVRVLIPGIETANPFYTGPRAHAVALRDLLPWTR